MTRSLFGTMLAVLLAGGFQARTAQAAGFDFFEQGSKAMGMAGAFVAQADDPSAIFYNLGGLALAEGKKAAAGVTVLQLNESLYQGLEPGIGAGTAGEQDPWMTLQPHVYAALPIRPDLTASVGIYSPFFLETRWIDPDSFAGREITTAAELIAYDLNPGLAYRLSPRIGIGLGLIYRTSDLSLSRRFFADNPFTGGVQDVAAVDMASDFSDGLGWNAGILHRLSDRFSWGFSYRSGISIDYSGIGRLTQISTGFSQLDELFAASLPLGQDLPTAVTIDFPQMATFGIAFGLRKSLRLEADLQWTGWSGFERLEVDFTTSSVFDQTIPQEFDDSLSVRIGAQYTTATGTQYRVGFALDETPQPEETVGAFLPDGTRSLFAFGFGKDWLDIAFTWVAVEQRIIRNELNVLSGNYRSNAWKLGITVSF